MGPAAETVVMVAYGHGGDLVPPGTGGRIDSIGPARSIQMAGKPAKGYRQSLQVVNQA
jgi:hypothetical protein